MQCKITWHFESTESRVKVCMLRQSAPFEGFYTNWSISWSMLQKALNLCEVLKIFLWEMIMCCDVMNFEDLCDVRGLRWGTWGNWGKSTCAINKWLWTHFFSWSIVTWFCELFFISVVTVYPHWTDNKQLWFVWLKYYQMTALNQSTKASEQHF